MQAFSGDVRAGVLHVGGAAISTVPQPDGPVTVGVRPEHLRLHATGSDAIVPARVDFIEPLGSHVLVTALVDVRDEELPGESAELRVIVQAPAGTELESGTRIGLVLPPERTYFFDAETGDARSSRERISL